MSTLPFEPMHLDEEDLMYELRLRNKLIDNGTSRNMTKLLRECLFKELKGLEKAPPFVNDVANECELIHDKFNGWELDISVAQSVRNLREDEINVFISKFNHLLYRLGRFASLTKLDIKAKLEIGKLTDRILKSVKRISEIGESSKRMVGLACAIVTTSDAILPSNLFYSPSNKPRYGAGDSLAQLPGKPVVVSVSTPCVPSATTSVETPIITDPGVISSSTGAISKHTVCALSNTENTYTYQNAISSTGLGRGRGTNIESSGLWANNKIRPMGGQNPRLNYDKPPQNLNNYPEFYPPIENYKINAHSSSNYAPINMNLPEGSCNANRFTNTREVYAPRPSYNSNMNMAANANFNFNQMNQQLPAVRQLPINNPPPQPRLLFNPVQQNQYFYQEPIPNNPEVRPWTNRNPVSGWNLFFSGDPGSRSFYDFISRIQLLAKAELVSPAMLRQSAYYLFSGSAMTWFRAFERN